GLMARTLTILLEVALVTLSRLRPLPVDETQAGCLIGCVFGVFTAELSESFVFADGLRVLMRAGQRFGLVVQQLFFVRSASCGRLFEKLGSSNVVAARMIESPSVESFALRLGKGGW